MRQWLKFCEASGEICRLGGPREETSTAHPDREDAMIGGFALVAAPADYRVTGVETFIVGYQGIVYQQDLGPDTLKIFKAMERYNPDKTWTRTNDSWPDDASDDSASAAQN